MPPVFMRIALHKGIIALSITADHFESPIITLERCLYLSWVNVLK